MKKNNRGYRGGCLLSVDHAKRRRNAGLPADKRTARGQNQLSACLLTRRNPYSYGIF